MADVPAEGGERKMPALPMATKKPRLKRLVVFNQTRKFTGPNKKRKLQKLVVFSHVEHHPQKPEQQQPSRPKPSLADDHSRPVQYQNSVTLDKDVWKYLSEVPMHKEKLDAIRAEGGVTIAATPSGDMILLTVTGSDEEKTRLANQAILKLRNEAVSSMGVAVLNVDKLAEVDEKALKRVSEKYPEFLIQVDDANKTVNLIGPDDKVECAKQEAKRALSSDDVKREDVKHENVKSEEKKPSEGVPVMRRTVPAVNRASERYKEDSPDGADAEISVFSTDVVPPSVCPLEPPPAVALRIIVDQSKIDASRCYLCDQPVDDPFRVGCGHVYCKVCLITWLREKLTAPLIF